MPSSGTPGASWGERSECGKNVGKNPRKPLFIPRNFDFYAFLTLRTNTREENMVMRTCVFGQRIVRLGKPSGGTGRGPESLRAERSNGSRSLRVERAAGRKAFGRNGPTVREAFGWNGPRIGKPSGGTVQRFAKPSGGTVRGSRSLRVERPGRSESLRVERSERRQEYPSGYVAWAPRPRTWRLSFFVPSPSPPGTQKLGPALPPGS